MAEKVERQTFWRKLHRLWPYIVAIVPATWVAFTWLENVRIEAEKQAELRLVEAKKPFLTKKLELYFETMNWSEQLIRTEPTSQNWEDARLRLLGLRYSGMQMVGNAATRERMRAVLGLIEDFRRGEADIWQIRGAVECLADELRRFLVMDWKGGREGDKSIAPDVTDEEKKRCVH